MSKLTLKDIAYPITLILGLAVAYGSMNTRLDTHDQAIKVLTPLITQMAVISEQLTMIKEDTVRIRQDMHEIHQRMDKTKP